MTEPITQGHDTTGGMPTSGSSGNAIRPPATVINALVANGSSRVLSRVFQLAWHTAATRTAAKTNGSISAFQARAGGIIGCLEARAHRDPIAGDVELETAIEN